MHTQPLTVPKPAPLLNILKNVKWRTRSFRHPDTPSGAGEGYGRLQAGSDLSIPPFTL